MSHNYHHTIDEFLGPKESRYFGSGYVNTSQIISDFTLTAGGDEIDFSCTGAVVISSLWSVKNSGKQKPHLSSIDVIEFTVECLRQITCHAFPGDQFSIESIQKIDVIAGTEPTEDRLDSLAIHGRFTKGPSGSGVLNMTVSNMKVHLKFSRANLKNGFPTGREKHPVLINDLLLYHEPIIASAIASPIHPCSTESWSLSSCFAAVLQLGQVLLYKHDRIDRKNSNTLWMRKVSISISPGVPSFDMPQPIHAKLEKVKKLNMDASEWRCADIFSIMCNTRIVCSVAHRI